MNRPLLLLALCAAIALPVRAQVSTPPASIEAACAALLPPDRPLPAGPDAPSIRIVSPAPGTVLGTAIAIRVQTTGFPLNDQAHHWHLWINGQLHGMVYGPDAVVDLLPGEYTLCASMGNPDHADLGMPAGVVITVEQPAPGTPVPTLPVSRDQAQVQPEGGPSPVQLILFVALALTAAVGGWFFGTRLSRRPR